MPGGGGDGFFLSREEYEVSFYESFPTCVLYFILILFYFFFQWRPAHAQQFPLSG